MTRRRMAGLLAGAALAAVTLAVPAAAAASTSAPARPAIAAASSAIIDGDGVNLPIVSNGHGLPVNTSTTTSAIFEKVADGSYYQLQQVGTTNCLTNNSAEFNEDYMEGCAGKADSTLWYSAASHVIVNVQVQVDQGETGNLTAETVNGCGVASYVDNQGGVALGCRVQWLIPS